MKLKDGTTKPFEKGTPVLYIPKHLLIGDKNKIVDPVNLGYVTSKNDKFVFVKFISFNQIQAVDPNNLYLIHNRPDLQAILDNTLQKPE